MSRVSSPAEATRPTIVSSSGSPAATSEPNASRRIAIVTGQLINSDFIIASRFAVLKSLHMPEAPVSETPTSAVPAALSFDFSPSAAATIAVGSPFPPAVTSAVWPSAEIEEPACGACTEATFSFACSRLVTRATVARKPGSAAVSPSEWTTTVSAELERPAKFAWTSSRARTESEPVASQPAPERTVSTLGAKAPSTSATTVQATTTERT